MKSEDIKKFEYSKSEEIDKELESKYIDLKRILNICKGKGKISIKNFEHLERKREENNLKRILNIWKGKGKISI